ncbi:hypothetical protein AS594_39315 [Streptomyces agglomeratus]|uniref:Uncharacterized protein n=1 Tax=Streptomyces agglomeratus TaxID=285458 RepID=A0A1E5NZ89_9ACTN|nr:hypothetical protein [Streptomyces agglomeratus]OEJ21584.1 hypothetical protein AS594_39315 [Streptomyces agglomeratus]
MTTAPARTTLLTACRLCTGRPATILESVSVSRLDNNRIADQRASELGDGAHTHADVSGDMHTVRPTGATS